MYDGVDSKSVALHDPTTKEEFAAYFKKKVPQIFNQLRHNAQSLAQRNWIGKNIVLQYYAVVCIHVFKINLLIKHALLVFRCYYRRQKNGKVPSTFPGTVGLLVSDNNDVASLVSSINTGDMERIKMMSSTIL